MKVCFAGGGTLGHVIPAISVINEMDEEVYYIASMKEEKQNVLINNKKIKKIIFINAKGFDRKRLYNNFKTIKINFKSKKVVEKFLKENSIDVVIGMGGYVGYIAIKAALNLNIKCLIHEQNSTMGLGNKLVMNKVDRVLLSYPINIKNSILIGNPRLSEVKNKYSNLCIQKSRSILVVGGSIGADVINDNIIKLKDFFRKENITCTLITGINYYKHNLEKIKENKDQNFNILNFSEDLIYHLLHNEIIISRGGATTISEIFALNKLCIFIPSPNVTCDHQKKNIDYYYQ